MIRQPKRRVMKPATNPYPGIVMIPVPIGLLKTIVDTCNQFVEYGDTKADKAKWERADAADFYRRGCEVAMEELEKIINANQKGE